MVVETYRCRVSTRRLPRASFCVMVLCGSCTSVIRPGPCAERTSPATPVASVIAQLSHVAVRTPQPALAKESAELSGPACADMNLVRLTRAMESESPAEAQWAVEQAGLDGLKLAIPWILETLEAGRNDRQQRTFNIRALKDVRSRNLLPAVMTVLPKECRSEYGLELSSAIEGDVGLSKAIWALGTDWEAWWSQHGTKYWQKDLRNWSDPDYWSLAWRMVPVYQSMAKPGEMEGLYQVPGNRYMYLGGYRPRLIRFDMQTGELILAHDPRPWYLALSPKESALHPRFTSIHEVGDEVWGAFVRPRGIAVLDQGLRLLRYHGTDREAIEAEYDRIVRFPKQIPIWPVDDQGRVWNYVDSVRAVRIYDGKRWEVLDLRPFATRTAALLKCLKCPPEGIAAYEREYVDVTWVHQITDGTICVGTSEGLLIYKEGRWRHLNALDNCLLGYTTLFWAGEGPDGQWWVGCSDSTNLYGLVCIQGAGEAMDSFTGWPSVRVPNEVLSDKNGRTWFEGGFLGTPSVMTMWTGSEWWVYPELPKGGMGAPSSSVVAPDGTVWFCNGALVGHIDGRSCEATAAPAESLLGLAIDAQGRVHVATKDGIWRLENSLWHLKASW